MEHRPETSAFRKLKQEDCEFKVSPDYMRLCPQKKKVERAAMILQKAGEPRLHSQGVLVIVQCLTWPGLSAEKGE